MPGRILITGAGGFIGKHLVEDQLRRGRQVLALDRDGESLRGIAPRDGLKLAVGDVTDPSVQRGLLHGIDIVFHLASAHLEKGLSAAQFHRANVEAVETLLEASLASGVRRFVHVSSCGIYGRLDRHPGDEDSPFHPDIAYERTKLAGESAARAFSRQRGLSVVVVRPVWVYGPGCKRTARLFRAIAGGKFVMVGSGKSRRAAVYITDLLDALERCATQPEIDGEAFIVTHDETVTVEGIVREISALVGAAPPRLRLPLPLAWCAAVAAEILAAATQRPPFITRSSLKFFTNDASFTCAKARRVLGFEPRVPLRQGLALTCQWWREIEDIA